MVMLGLEMGVEALLERGHVVRQQVRAGVGDDQKLLGE
jgi:hypothetical protein